MVIFHSYVSLPEGNPMFFLPLVAPPYTSAHRDAAEPGAVFVGSSPSSRSSWATPGASTVQWRQLFNGHQWPNGSPMDPQWIQLFRAILNLRLTLPADSNSTARAYGPMVCPQG